jgi:hypothetical protein
MDAKSPPFFRALRLLWNRMGSGRIYFVGGAALLFVLAAIGLGHLLSSPRTSKQPNPAPTPRTAVDASVTSAPAREPVIAITEIGSSETRERNGQLTVAVRIGVAPRPNTKKGEVEIRVSFFDVTPTGEMRATDAQVDYQWLTPVRDWTDPTPKYLVAKYLGAGPARKSGDELRYGGFLVRVYFDGQLQAEQSEPKTLVTALRNQQTSPASTHPVAIASPTAPAVQSTAPPSLQSNRESSSQIPYASPVPDKPGFVYSPYNQKFLIDVRGFPPGTEVKDPNTGKLLKVP